MIIIITKMGRCASAEEVKIHAKRALREVTIDALQKCFEKWYELWQKYVMPGERTLKGVFVNGYVLSRIKVSTQIWLFFDSTSVS